MQLMMIVFLEKIAMRNISFFIRCSLVPGFFLQAWLSNHAQVWLSNHATGPEIISSQKLKIFWKMSNQNEILLDILEFGHTDIF